ncbi:MAG TPA: DUF6644 family protein [Bryobacteraceae bacterium]|nr:DUF6644 family protein [Bryobacteraceae bacterium]
MLSLHSLVDSFDQWCYQSSALSILRDTKLGIPAVQTAHLLGIMTVLGTTTVMNLRLLNLGYRELSAETFLPQVWTWFRRGLFLTLIAGFIVFLPDPVRYAQNTSFQVKMATLAIAIAFQFTVFRKRVHSPAAGSPTAKTIAICGVSMILWFGVGWCGRAIAFFG